MFESCMSRMSQQASKSTTTVTTTTTTTSGDDIDKQTTTTTAGLAILSASHRGGPVLVGAARRPSKVLIPESKTLGVPQKEMVGQPSPWGEGRPTGSPSPPVPESTGGRLGRGRSPCQQGCDHRTVMPGASSHKAGDSGPDRQIPAAPARVLTHHLTSTAGAELCRFSASDGGGPRRPMPQGRSSAVFPPAVGEIRCRRVRFLCLRVP